MARTGAPGRPGNRSRTARRKIAAVAALSAMAGFAATLTGIVHPDWYPGISTYGVSVGSQTDYCSADLTHWVLEVGCERAP